MEAGGAPMEVDGAEEVTLQAAPSLDIGDVGGESAVTVSVVVPDGGSRVPVDICCLVDISGSMATIATYEVEGVTKDDGLSILDIVKHAVRAVMHILGDRDRLSIVAFDDKAETVFALSAMTEAGREDAVRALEILRPRGQTNLWDGVVAGMESLRALSPDAGVRQKTLLLLTDGMPNISPPRGHLRELRAYKESHTDLDFQINTFGFGYSLDSELLLELAVEGRGTYAFIPDAVIVGTVFVNSVANALSTKTQDATLHLMVQNGAEFIGPVIGDLPVTEASSSRIIALGPLQFGQSRSVVVPMRIPGGSSPYLQVVLEYSTLDGPKVRIPIEATCRSASSSAAVATLRNEVVSVGYAAVKDAESGKGQAAQRSIVALAGRLSAAEATNGDDDISALRLDVDGRMSKAVKGKERFTRWGKHYLRALMRAHQVQQCTNFMDPGLQDYGGSLFSNLRDEGDNVFLSLRPPKPAVEAARMPPAGVPPTGATAGRPPSAPAQRSTSPDMRTYYAGSGGG